MNASIFFSFFLNTNIVYDSKDFRDAVAKMCGLFHTVRPLVLNIQVKFIRQCRCEASVSSG